MEMVMVYLLLLSISTFLLFKLLSTTKTKNLPPSPPSLPVIGHLHLFKKPLHRTLATLSNRYGPILYLRFGSRPVLVVTSPSAAEECLTKNDVIFANRPRLLHGKHMGNNYTTIPFASYGDIWRNLRRITAIEIFSSTRINMFSDIRHDEVRCMVRRLIGCKESNEYQTVEMKSVFFELMLNIVMRTIAGKSYYGENVAVLEDATRFKEIVTETLLLGGASNIVDFLPMLRWFGKTRTEKRLIRLKLKRDEFLQDLIQAHRKFRNTSSTGEEGKGKKKTLIDVLLNLQETEPEYYTDEMILGIIWVMLAAGTDTSAGTMEWAMSFLLNNGEIIQKAQAEIDNSIEEGQLLTEPDLIKLPYLNCIINETLRMYPAAPMLLPHESSEECVVGGYNIPSGTMLLVNQWAIQNDPKLWDQPTEFKPERFHGLQGTRDGFKLMPFGSGRRGCPGEGLAMHVVGLALGTLIQCFDWERIGGELMDMSEGTGLTLPKARPLVAKCRPRSNMMNPISQL